MMLTDKVWKLLEPATTIGEGLTRKEIEESLQKGYYKLFTHKDSACIISQNENSIRIGLGGGKMEEVKKIVEKRINPLISPHLKFNFVDDKDLAVIRIQFNELGGCSSKIGSQAKQVTDRSLPTMQFAWFDVGTVLHEFGHAVGLIHEHQNPKGNDIEWDKTELYKWGNDQGWGRDKVDEQIINRMKLNSINGSEYDPKSIMLYFYPPKVTTNKKGTSQNLVLSDTDKNTIKDQYGDSNMTTGQTFSTSLIITGVLICIGVIFVLYKLKTRK